MDATDPNFSPSAAALFVLGSTQHTLSARLNRVSHPITAARHPNGWSPKWSVTQMVTAIWFPGSKWHRDIPCQVLSAE